MSDGFWRQVINQAWALRPETPQAPLLGQVGGPETGEGVRGSLGVRANAEAGLRA